MIDLILKMLELDVHYGQSKEIDIAKGYYKMPFTFNEAWEQRKMKKAWQ